MCTLARRAGWAGGWAYRHRDGFAVSSRLKVVIFAELRRAGFLTRTEGVKP